MTNRTAGARANFRPNDGKYKQFYSSVWLVFFGLVALTLATPVSAAGTVDVFNGSGSGTYEAGEEVFVSAYPCENDCDELGGLEPRDPAAPKRIFDQWVGADVGLLENPQSADTRFLMPNGNVVLEAQYKDAPRWTAPTVVTNFPANHDGVIFMNHGATGCAQCLWIQPQTRFFIDDAASRGFAVVAVDSFDRVNKSWQDTDYALSPDPATNIDMQRLAAVRQQLITEGRMSADDPVYLVGISNGGVFSSLFNQAAQDSLNFPIDAMAFIISSGSPAAGATPDQTVPIFFALGENDSHPDGTYAVNPAAVRHYDALLQRNIPTQLHIARERPINPDSFWRIEGVTQSESNAIYTAFATAGVIDGEGYLADNPDLFDWVSSLPEELADNQNAIGDVLQEHYTDHEVMNEFNDRLFTFLRDPTTFVEVVPVITDVSPLSGIPGTVVTVSGENFVGVQSVTLNGTPVEIRSARVDSLVFQVPATATSGLVEVSNAAGTGASAEAFEVILTPVIDSFSPETGYPGTTVIIAGSNLANVTAAAVNGEPASVTVISNFRARIVVPLDATTGPITLTNNAGSVDSASVFTVDRTPRIDSFEPTSGEPGTIVIIRGAGFVDNPAVSIGGENARIVYSAPTQLRALVDTNAETGPVQVTNDNATATAASNFTVLHPDPAITAFSPTRGKPGTVVKIDGANFSSVNAVTFGGVAAQILNQTATGLWVKVPQGAVTGPIIVADPWGSDETSGDFEILSAPTVTEFTPDRGPLGTQVTVTGTGFRYVTDVKLATIPVPYTVVSDTTITLTVSEENGTLSQYSPIYVFTEGGFARSSTVFRLQ